MHNGKRRNKRNSNFYKGKSRVYIKEFEFADTRTLSQQIALQALASKLLKQFPGSKVVGHRDLSLDKNYNGINDPWERIKECPAFDVLKEVWE